MHLLKWKLGGGLHVEKKWITEKEEDDEEEEERKKERKKESKKGKGDSKAAALFK